MSDSSTQGNSVADATPAVQPAPAPAPAPAVQPAPAPVPVVVQTVPSPAPAPATVIFSKAQLPVCVGSSKAAYGPQKNPVPKFQ